MSSNEVHFDGEDVQTPEEERSADAVIKRMMASLGVATQSALADVLGVHRAAVSDAKRQNRVPAEWLLRLLRSNGLNPSWLETGRGVAKISEIREHDEGIAEHRSWAEDFVMIYESEAKGATRAMLAFRRDWLSRQGDVQSMRLMRIGGESMKPTMEDNDLVLVDCSQRSIQVGKSYALRMDDQIVVRRLEKKPGVLILISDNRSLYEPLEIDVNIQKNMTIVGRVIWLCRNLP
jgi:phage repressor protein C with HTH and peptisase S24 domain